MPEEPKKTEETKAEETVQKQPAQKVDDSVAVRFEIDPNAHVAVRGE